MILAPDFQGSRDGSLLQNLLLRKISCSKFYVLSKKLRFINNLVLSYVSKIIYIGGPKSDLGHWSKVNGLRSKLTVLSQSGRSKGTRVNGHI